MGKTRIAVLGSGPGALGAVWEITQSPGWAEKFEIDIYAMGWRLGGKTASGRNIDCRFENEEHGLHILGGFYHNLFQQLDPLYAAWGLHPEDCAVALDDAVFKHGTFSVLQTDPGNRLREVRITIPDNGLRPGVDPHEVTVSEIMSKLLKWLKGGFSALSAGQAPALFGAEQDEGAKSEALRSTAKGEGLASLAIEQVEFAAIANDLEAAHYVALRLGDLADPADESLVANATERALAWFQAHDNPLVKMENADWFGLAALASTIVWGLFKDRVFATGFDAIDDRDAAQWLSDHGAPAAALRNANFAAGYSYAFAFDDGDPSRRNFAAGTALRGYLRMIFASHGNLFYHMRGGMGEVFALPYYDVLRRRGVRFHFFHKVTSLEPDGVGSLARVLFEVQAQPSAAYDPIVTYQPDPAAPPRRTWPSRPLWEQLKNCAELSTSGIDFESFHGPVPPGAGTKTLVAGQDFDLCILAIPSGMLRLIATPLGADSGAWRDFLANVGTAPTIAAQTWRKESSTTYMGLSRQLLMTGFELPLDTWADMSFLLPFEQPLPDGSRPKDLSYFCGAVPHGNNPVGPDLPDAEQVRADQIVGAWMGDHLARAFPGLGARDGYLPEIERIARINSDPAKLYVTSPAGSTRYRLRPDASGYANMFLAGDWTRHNFDCGAVESAIISARVCSRAICGYPKAIYGESDHG